jgi:HEPN domain-containing protein
METIKNWILKATEDMDAMDALFHIDSDKHASAICFHAHQAVEKFLKVS